MKKIMLALMVASVAFLANAAVVNWSMGGIQNLTDSKGTAIATSSNTGSFTAYLISSTLSDTDLVAAIKDGTLASNSAIVETTTIGASRGNVKLNWDVSSATDRYTAGITYSFYTVLVGNNYYLKTDTLTVETPTLGTLDMDFGTFTAGTASNPTWQPVPEPTSGLLLLVGGALLALRRKQK